MIAIHFSSSTLTLILFYFTELLFNSYTYCKDPFERQCSKPPFLHWSNPTPDWPSRPYRVWSLPPCLSGSCANAPSPSPQGYTSQWFSGALISQGLDSSSHLYRTGFLLSFRLLVKWPLEFSSFLVTLCIVFLPLRKFSPGGDHALPWGLLAMSRDVSPCHNTGEALLASGKWRPGILLNPCRAQNCPHPKEFSSQVQRCSCEKPSSVFLLCFCFLIFSLAFNSIRAYLTHL